MAERHTIVIPTFNRPALVRRLVSHYRRQAPSSRLLVLDSSGPEVVKENARALAADNVSHVPYPEDLPPAAKIARGLALVTTPYASFCADDDLVFAGALGRSIDFLERHADYATAHGLYLNFRAEGADVHLSSEYAGPGNELAAPGARVFRLLQKYESLFYGVYRTPLLRDILERMQAIPAVAFQELFQSVATVLSGKVKRFPAFYAARQSGPPAEPRRDKWQTYYWFAENPGEVLQHYAAYCERLWSFHEAHAPAPRLDRAAFERTLHLAHAVYFSAGCPPEYFHSALQAYWPADAYADVRGHDVLDELAPTGGSGHALGRLWQRFMRRAQSASLGFGLSRLNQGRWSCHLPLKLHWLSHNADFRAGWLELCRYLDADRQ